MDREVIILVGSPKKEKSTSYALSKHLSDELNHLNVESNILYASDVVDIPESFLETCDCLVIACPLYCDNLPADIIEFMDKLYQHKEKISQIEIMLMINSGFPEASHNALAIKTAENFASKMNFNWLGALFLGEGGIISGQNLNDISVTKKIRKAINLLAYDLKCGQEISQSAVNLAKEKMLPYPIYIWSAEKQWKKKAKRLGTTKQLKNAPYTNEL